MTHGFETLAIHAGQEPDPATGAVVPPIFQTSTYAQDAVGHPRRGYEYSRTTNPTRDALQECLAAIEGGRKALSFASGLAAEDTLLRTVCQPGDHVVIPDDAYGGTYRLFAKVAEKVAFHQNAMGAVPGPFDAFLTHRGIKTLGVRMDRHSANAAEVAEFLTGHAKVAQVYYPGLAEHPGHEIAAKQMRAFGGMISFRHVDGEQAAVEVCNRAKLFTLGESLGGVESLIEHPGRMTHASVAGSALEVPADLVRLSVGIESANDLIGDLAQALG
jgi:cystathionine beta-lyase/cystathionine gamma-synthase